MQKNFVQENTAFPFDKRGSHESHDFLQEIPKAILTEEKKEYDFKEHEVEEVEKLINSKLLCNIGYGGFSTVKLIFNNQQKTYYAMKVVNLNNKKFKKKTPSKNREFIYQEILVNFNARNSNIVKLYGYFNHKEYILLILEYMNNRDLKHFMKKFHSNSANTNLSEMLTGFFMIQILKAMGYLKVRNILHRDIKPENIMLNNNYVAKLGDFSLSRKLDLNSIFKTSRSGTLPYLSPECVKKKINIKSVFCEKLDLFSLGIVMYYLLFNTHPFNYKNHMSCVDYSRVMQTTTPSFLGNNITDCCKDFLQGLLNKDFEKRLSFDKAMSHPWIVLVKTKVDSIVEKFQHDPEKMINLLNQTKIDSDYFNAHHYTKIEIDRDGGDSKFSNKKRKRNEKSF